MAGEVEERMGSQGVSFASESVSFGRFKSESLSWERRSSFSHNRYIEEAEKNSPRGSVTQMKAFFEAHFKKKGFLSPASSGLQNDNDGANEEEFDQVKSDVVYGVNGQFTFSENTLKPFDTDHHEQGEEENENSRNINQDCYHQALENSDGHESFHQYNENTTLETESEKAQHVTDGLTFTEEAFSCPRSTFTKKASVEVVPKTEETDLFNFTRRDSSEKTSVSSGKAFMKSLKDMREMMQRTKLHEPSSLNVSLAATVARSGKKNGCVDFNDDSRRWTRSNKDSRETRNCASSYSSSRKDQVRPSVNRGKKVFDPFKERLQQETATFNFRTDERAEKRKAFYVRLEEKMHAKEVELNEKQTRFQEESLVEIKQFRRSLNFKATPLPSFYHESSPKAPGSKKVASKSRQQ